MVVFLRYTIVCSICILSLNIHSYAKSHFASLPTNTQKDLTLLKQIANSPSLLNPDYLQYFVGIKTSKMTAPLSQSLRSPAPVERTFWLNRESTYVRYIFEQSLPESDKFLAEFSILLTRPEDVLLKDLHKVLDEDPTYTIDENGRPAQLLDRKSVV